MRELSRGPVVRGHDGGVEYPGPAVYRCTRRAIQSAAFGSSKTSSGRFWLSMGAKMGTARDFMRSEILRTEHRAFALGLVFAIGSYAGVTLGLNAIRKTAALWIVWVLVAVQLALLLSIFVVSTLRARQCGVRHTWLFFLPFLLTRINDWEVVVIPAFAAIMLLWSARNRNVSRAHEHLLPSDSDDDDQPRAGRGGRTAAGG